MAVKYMACRIGVHANKACKNIIHHVIFGNSKLCRFANVDCNCTGCYASAPFMDVGNDMATWRFYRALFWQGPGRAHAAYRR